MQSIAIRTRLTRLAQDIDLRASLGAACLAVAILSGKFGLGSELLAVRFYATLAAVVLLLPQLKGLRLTGAAWTVIALLTYLLFRSFIEPASRTGEGQIDLAYMILQIVLVTAAVRVGFASLVAVTLAIAATMFVAAVAGQFFPELGSGSKSGLGWGPIGTVITFTRIEFLGFCLALAVAPLRRAGAVLAAVFLYATLASILKAALVACLLALLVIVMLLLLNRRWRELALVAGVSVTACLGFQITYADGFVARVESVVAVGNQTIDSAKPVDTEKTSCNAELPACRGYLSARIDYCVRNKDGSYACESKNFYDGSQRLIFLLEAIRGAVTAPIFGHGVGHFEVMTTIPNTDEIEKVGHPHNLVAEIAFAGGIIGLALLILAFGALCMSLTQSVAAVYTRCVIAGFVVFMLAVSLFGGDIYDTRFLWLAALATIHRWPAPAPSTHDERVAA